jgi:hypothetical protein
MRFMIHRPSITAVMSSAIRNKGFTSIAMANSLK